MARAVAVKWRGWLQLKHPIYKIMLGLVLGVSSCITWLAPVQVEAFKQFNGAREVTANSLQVPSGISREIPLENPLRFEHLTIEEGLSQNAILAIMQDSRGYLWLGTQDGLNRYDGYEFAIFKHQADNPNSLSHNSILSMLEDGQGILWFGTWGGGLNRYDPNTGQFTRYRHNPIDPDSLADDLVTALHEDKAGRLWVATAGGLDELDRQAGVFRHYANNPQDSHSLSSSAISTILEDSAGKLWLGTGGFGTPGAGLNHFDPATGQSVRYRHNSEDPNTLSSDTISNIIQASDGSLWVGTGGFYLDGAGLNHFDPQTGRVTRYQNNPQDEFSLANDNVLTLKLDPDGLLWIGLWGGGLDLLDLTQSSRAGTTDPHFIHQRHDPFEDSSLSADIVWSLFEDRSGVIWVGTINGGLNKLNPQLQRFRLYRNHPGNPDSLSFNVTGTFLEDQDGGIWVGTWGGGLDFFDLATGKFSHYVNKPGDPTSLPDNTIGSILEDSQGRLWVGSFSGLSLLEKSTGRFETYKHDPQDPNSLINDNISKLIEDNNGRLWVATLGGLDVFDQEQKRFIHIKLPPGIQPVTLTLDRNGTLWVGTWGQGLISLDPDSLDEDRVAYSHYQHDPEQPSSLVDDNVWVIFEDERGMLWVGAQTGLDRFDRFTDTFTHFQELNRLPNNTILCIQEDSQGKLWISTNNGLIQFEPLRGRWRNYDVSDGLQSSEFNSGACLETRAGQMVFGGVRGFNIFDPQEIQPNPEPPPVAVTNFRVFNEPVQVDLSGATPLELNYKQNFISFDFAGLDFHAPQRNRYQYKLEGVDKDWVDSGDRRFASYTNLNGGSYLFRVKASNNDGVWNETGLTIPVRVNPPFWQTWWFQAGFLLGVVLLASGGAAWRIEQVRGQNRRLEAVVDQRTSSLLHVNSRLEDEIEQRKRAELELARRAAEELQQAEARFIAMYEHAAVGIVITSLERRFLRGNPAIQRMLGYSEEELQQTDILTMIHPQDRLSDADLFEELAAGKRDAYNIEKRYLRKDGSLFWGRLNYSLVRTADGSPQFAIGILEDIDAQKQAIQNLEQSEARFRAMFEHAAVSIAVISLERRAVTMNPTAERTLGYTRTELSDHLTTDFIFPEDVPIDQDEFTELVQGERDSYTVEKRYLHKDGSLRWGRITHSLVRGANGQPAYILSMMEDIDEQKRAQEHLAARDAEYRQLLEQTVQVRTHELREANARLEQEIEQRKRAEEALAVKAAEEAVSAERNRLARDLHDAVTQTLFSASLTAEVLPDLWKMDEEEALRTTEDLRQLTRGALAEMRTLLLELRPATLSQTPFEDLLRQLVEALVGRARLPVRLEVQGTRRLPPDVQVALYRIAQEALNNVVKYARASEVVVSLQMSQAGVHLEIRDNGVGFNLGEVSATSMGQRIMRERAENINADLEVTSVPGKGATVAVSWTEASVLGFFAPTDQTDLEESQ